MTAPDPTPGIGARLRMHPTVLAAVITGVLGLVTALVVAFTQAGGGDEPSTALQVQDVTLTSTVGQFNVRCPMTFAYEGSISVSAGSGDVAYRFVYRDGIDQAETAEDIRTVAFAGPGSAPVRYEWRPTIPQGDVSRTVILEVVQPVSRRSEPVTISGRCDADLPPGPDVPPPDVDPPR